MYECQVLTGQRLVHGCHLRSTTAEQLALADVEPGSSQPAQTRMQASAHSMMMLQDISLAVSLCWVTAVSCLTPAA